MERLVTVMCWLDCVLNPPDGPQTRNDSEVRGTVGSNWRLLII